MSPYGITWSQCVKQLQNTLRHCVSKSWTDVQCASDMHRDSVTIGNLTRLMESYNLMHSYTVHSETESYDMYQVTK